MSSTHAPTHAPGRGGHEFRWVNWGDRPAFVAAGRRLRETSIALRGDRPTTGAKTDSPHR